MLSEGARENLKKFQVEINELADVVADLNNYADRVLSNNSFKFLIPAKSLYLSGAPFAIYDALKPLKSNLEIDESPVLKLKSVKNDVEAQGLYYNCKCNFNFPLNVRIPLALVPWKSSSAKNPSRFRQSFLKI